MPSLDSIEFWITAYAVVLSVVEAIRATGKLRHLWRTRHLRRVWGIKDGDQAIVVCSELDDPASRQQVEPREFIYSLKYGDVDAYVEVLITLLRLYPSIRLRVMSAGEVESTRLNLSRHLIVIGGPDYNGLSERILGWGNTKFDYRSPHVSTRSADHPDEIVLYDRDTGREYCHKTDIRDFGYFERLPNPHNPKSQIVMIGGCHTIGVAGAAKAFSLAESDDGEIPSSVLSNAASVARKIRKAAHFSVLVEVERMGQTISVPLVHNDQIAVKAPAAEQQHAADGASRRS
jgi:hypothetical protein